MANDGAITNKTINLSSAEDITGIVNQVTIDNTNVTVSNDIISNSTTFIQAVNTSISNIDVTGSFEEVFVKATQITVATETIASNGDFNNQVVAPTDAEIANVTIATESIINLKIQPGVNIIYTFYDGNITNVNSNNTIYKYSSDQYQDTPFTNNSIDVSKNTGYFINNTNDSYDISYGYTGSVPTSFDCSVNSGWNIVGWNSSIANSTASVSSNLIESNTLHMYDSSTNTITLITDDSIQANIGYWIKCNASGQITITPNSSIIMNNDILKIDLSKYQLNSKPSFSKRNNTITNSNIHFMLLEWIYNKERAIFMYGDIRNWDVSHVTSFEKLFYFIPIFNEDISNWNTSNVTDMSYMFYNCTHFNNDITMWNIEKVINFKGMFKGINQEFINNYDINKNIDEFGNPNRTFFINNTI